MLLGVWFTVVADYVLMCLFGFNSVVACSSYIV